MASLRHAALAYAVEGYGPSEVLESSPNFVGEGAKRHFATVMCALIERDQHIVSVASAGHLPPLIIEGSEASFLELDGGTADRRRGGASLPGGAPRRSPRRRSSSPTPTAGGAPRRVLDVGLERLRKAAVGERCP